MRGPHRPEGGIGGYASFVPAWLRNLKGYTSLRLSGIEIQARSTRIGPKQFRHATPVSRVQCCARLLNNPPGTGNFRGTPSLRLWSCGVCAVQPIQAFNFRAADALTPVHDRRIGLNQRSSRTRWELANLHLLTLTCVPYVTRNWLEQSAIAGKPQAVTCLRPQGSRAQKPCRTPDKPETRRRTPSRPLTWPLHRLDGSLPSPHRSGIHPHARGRRSTHATHAGGHNRRHFVKGREGPPLRRRNRCA